MQVKTAAFTLAAALFVLSHGAVVAAPGEPTEPTPTGPNQPPGAKDNFDPIYNVCRGTDPRCYHPWVADRLNKVLLYTRTAGPRHAKLGPALPAGLNPPLTPHIAQNAIIQWMNEVGVVTHWTEDVTVLTQLQSSDYSRYRAVIFLSTSRDTLWAHGTAVSTTAAVNTTTNAHLDRRQDGAAPIHSVRRRLRRNSQCVRHRVQLEVVRRPARRRQLFRPWREPGRLGQDRRPGFVHVGHQQLRLSRRVVQP